VNLDDLKSLDVNNIGVWPTPAKGLVLAVLAVMAGFGWYHMATKDQLAELDKVRQQEQSLRTEFEGKQAKAANLEAYKKQLAEMEQSFGAMLRQLPDRTEVAALLVDVSQTGLAAGLEFELFDPTGEQRKEFYAELPIKLKVNGSYHEFGEFISGLAALPRIVTIHDVLIYPKGQEKGKSKKKNKGEEVIGDGTSLTLEATAKTYRYLDEDEVMEQEQEQKQEQKQKQGKKRAKK
jgi:type IV pilus assembly protein PilO